MNITEFYEELLLGQLNIHRINQHNVSSNISNVRVLTFSSKSLIFASDLQFPISESVTYQINLKIHNTDLELYGQITATIKSDKGKANLYEFTYILNKQPIEPESGHLLAYRKQYLQKYNDSMAYKKYE